MSEEKPPMSYRVAAGATPITDEAVSVAESVPVVALLLHDSAGGGGDDDDDHGVDLRSTTPSDLKLRLTELLGAVSKETQRYPSPQPSSKLEFNPQVQNCPVMTKVLRFFVGVSTLIEHLRTKALGKIMCEGDMVMLSALELLLDDPNASKSAQEAKNEENVFWDVMNQVLRKSDPVCNVIRSDTCYENLTECSEIALNLLVKFVRADHEHFEKLCLRVRTEMEKWIRPGLLEYPKQDWFLKTGTSLFLHAFSYLNLPKNLQRNLNGPEYSVNIANFITHIFQKLGLVTSPTQTTSTQHFPNYSKMTSGHAVIVREQLTRVLSHIPAVIEKFWNKCPLVPLSIKFGKLDEDMISIIVAQTNCTNTEAFELITRLKEVLSKCNSTGVLWEKFPRGDLIGLSLLLRHDLLVFINRGTPSVEHLQRLTSCILTSKATPDPEVSLIIDLIVQDLYMELNQAFFKAKIHLVAELVSYRMAVETTWDLHTYLLRKDVLELTAHSCPKFVDHKRLISVLESQLTKKKPSKLSIQQKKTNDAVKVKISQLREDAKLKDPVILVMMEIDEKLSYVAKTSKGNPCDFNSYPKMLELQGIKLEMKKAPSLVAQLLDAIYECELDLREKHTFLYIGLVTTNSDSGRLLALAIGRINVNRDLKIAVIPERILTCYDQTRKQINKAELLDEAWVCFQTNLGSLSANVLRRLMNPITNRRPLTEWEFQLDNPNLPLDVVSVILHVATCNIRISFHRCLRDKFYFNSIIFLMQETTERQQHIHKAIKLVGRELESKTLRDALLRSFSKSEILKFLGLTSEEIEKFSQYFYWEDKYPIDSEMEGKRLFFGALIDEKHKRDLVDFLQNGPYKGKDDKIPSTTNVQDRFTRDICKEKDAVLPGITLDPSLPVRIRRPDEFFKYKRADLFATFGSQFGTEFQNSDIFSFHSLRTVKFVVSHLPVHTYLVPLVSMFPKEFPSDVKEYAMDKEKKEDPSILAKSQIYVICALCKLLKFNFFPKDKDAELNTIMTKNTNSIIVNLLPPSRDHKYETSASLLNLTYLDNGKCDRIAGRPVSVTKFIRKPGVSWNQVEIFRKEVVSKFASNLKTQAKELESTDLLLPTLLQHVEFPDMKQYFLIDTFLDRLRLSKSKLDGSFPYHLEVELDLRKNEK